MNLVVDASVAAQWFIKEPDSEAARRLLSRQHKLFAPELVLLEIANVLFKSVVRGDLMEGDAQSILTDIRRPWHSLVTDGDLFERAALLSIHHRHPVYDCLYLALAEREHAQLVTIDKRLLSIFGQQGAFNVIHLHDL